MSTQISVRIDDRLVAFLDDQVKSGQARSRAELVESALERELRRRLYAEEVQRLMAQKAAGALEDDDLAGLAEWSRNRTYPDLD